MPASDSAKAVRQRGGYHGRLERDRRTRSMRLVESRYARGTRLPAHDHAHAHLCIVLQGTYEERVGARTFERVPLDVVWYPAEAGHAEAFRSDGRHLLVDLAQTPTGVGARDVVLLEGPAVLACALGIVQLLRAAVPCTELDLEEAVAALLAEMDGHRHWARGEPEWVARVETELRDRYRERTTLEELATTAGVTVPHLARSWRRFRGETLGDSLRGLRIAHACRRLVADRASLAEVALEAGFADQSHMGRVLRRHVGHSPAGLQRFLRT